jgi:site-specific DNA-methyltransferase (adenine-specific)
MITEPTSPPSGLASPSCYALLDSVECIDNVQGCAKLESESVHLVVTSPPYDDLRTYGGHSWDFDGLADELCRVLVPGGVIVWVVNDATIDGSETGTSFRQALGFIERGMRLHDTMIYKTNKPPCGNARYQPAFEYMFVISKGAPRYFSPLKEKSTWAGVGTSPRMRDKDGELKGKGRRIIQDEKVRENIWHYPSGNGKEANFGHPAPFPVALAKDHIASWTRAGDIVLDPFMGSGTTAEASKELGRHFIGFEINPDYCDLWKMRTAQEMLGI